MAKVTFKDGTTRQRKTRITSQKENERVVYLINEVLQDIDEFGRDHEVIVFYVNGKIEDYATQQREMIYPEEDVQLMKLIDLLVELYILIMPTKISAVIKSHRLALDMSQEELASKVNSSQPVVGEWERGKYAPGITYVFKLIDCLQIDKRWFD